MRGSDIMQQHERAQVVLEQVAELASVGNTKAIKQLLRSVRGQDVLKYPLVQHQVECTPRAKWCAVCFRHVHVIARDEEGRETKKRSTRGGRVKTRCQACKVHLCIRKACWDEWHCYDPSMES